MKLSKEVKNETIAWVKAKVQDLYDAYIHYRDVEFDKIRAESYKFEMLLTLRTYMLLVDDCDDFVNMYIELFYDNDYFLNETIFK